ncbi:hypothetical protein ACQW02_11510 [Humitalea sp. 24SJ18S-53]|uniref:hypothetical protein n=1 Tax=Humitalea sp. 24SJ18S-53 TaxID=3422307 RepID=UPI003D679FB8
MAYQAHARSLRRLSLVAGGLFSLGGCIGGGGNEGLGTFWDNATGRAMERRGLPPRLDQPWPNLAQVPPRPARPDPASLNAVTRQLETERAGMETPLVAGLAIPAPPAGLSANVPLTPPGPPSLRPAPRVNEAPIIQIPAAVQVPTPAVPAPAEPARTMPADPGSTAPPPPPPALLAPAAPPARMMPADPGSVPPPPPSIR